MWVCWTEDAPEEWEQFWVEPLNGSRKEDKLIKKKEERRKEDDFEAERSTEKMKMWKRLRKLDGKKIHARLLAHEKLFLFILTRSQQFPIEEGERKTEFEFFRARNSFSLSCFSLPLSRSVCVTFMIMMMWRWAHKGGSHESHYGEKRKSFENFKFHFIFSFGTWTLCWCAAVCWVRWKKVWCNRRGTLIAYNGYVNAVSMSGDGAHMWIYWINRDKTRRFWAHLNIPPSAHFLNDVIYSH